MEAVRPGDKGYDDAARVFFGAGEPALVVRPRVRAVPERAVPTGPHRHREASANGVRQRGRDIVRATGRSQSLGS